MNYLVVMNLLEYLNQEWVPALGCTEPASIALAGINANKQLEGPTESIKLIVDPRIYKNCYAVGIPHSGHQTGIKWAAGIGAFLKDKDAGLQCFRSIDNKILESTKKLIDKNKISIEVDKTKENLFIHFEVKSGNETAIATIEETHTNVTKIEKNGKTVFEGAHANHSKQNEARKWAHSLSIKEMLKLVTKMDDICRIKIREGIQLNEKIAKHGITLLPESFVKMFTTDPLSKIAGLVCCGVYARMCGEDFSVMSIAGSGNKGITCTVPLLELETEWKTDPRKIEEALALAMLVASKTTEELGTLSAVCGCSNAAGIGLACAIVYIMNGNEKQIAFAINNMVGNVTGMICDGAKIGCALKTMTAVDAAFRSAMLAINDIGIPPQDGIVGKSGSDSLANMGKIAKKGMIKTDLEILKIMEKKL